MDRKSFFRGFGIGILFASLILGVSFVIRTSDSFTKRRALELGMIYESNGDAKTVLSKNAGDDLESAEELAESVEKKTEEKTGSKKTDSKKTDSKKTDSKKTDSKKTDMKKEKEKLEKNVKSEQQKLTIRAGEWSTAVSKKLQEMGIIKDATDFDKWLDKNGYSSFISAGTYNVSEKDTYHDLAEKITGNRNQ